jgi:ketosteroid isomerase-like protein
MSSPEENITTILTDWLDALRRHDLDTVERRLAPDVVWQGVHEDLMCQDRAAVLDTLREQQREDYGVEALEVVGTESHVMLGIRSTQLQEIGDVPLGGQIFNVFTLDNGRIVRIEDYPRREEALAAADAKSRGDWL